jgi:hypothetical protein
MPTRARKSRDRDFFVNARRVVEQAIGEQMDGQPRRGASQDSGCGCAVKTWGGKARAAKLTSAKRKAIAKKSSHDALAYLVSYPPGFHPDKLMEPSLRVNLGIPGASETWRTIMWLSARCKKRFFTGKTHFSTRR